MKAEIASAALQRLLGINKSVLGELAQKGIIVRGEKRGSYALQASVSCYCEHLREQAAGRGGEAGADVRARLGAAQADLAAEKVKAMRGETLPTAEVGGVPVKLASELRATLTELAMMPQHRQCAR